MDSRCASQLIVDDADIFVVTDNPWGVHNGIGKQKNLTTIT